MGLFDQFKFGKKFSFSHSAQPDRIIGKSSDLKANFDSRGDELSDAFDAFVDVLSNGKGTDISPVATQAFVENVLRELTIPETTGVGAMPHSIYDPRSYNQNLFTPAGDYTQEEKEDASAKPDVGMMRKEDKDKLDRITLPDGSDPVSVPLLSTSENVDATNDTTAITPKAAAGLAVNGVKIEKIWENSKPDDTNGFAETDDKGITPVTETASGSVVHKVTDYDMLVCEFKLSTGSTVYTTAMLIVAGDSAQSVRATAHNASVTYSRTFYASGEKIYFSNGSQGSTATAPKAMIPLRVYGIALQVHNAAATGATS